MTSYEKPTVWNMATYHSLVLLFACAVSVLPLALCVTPSPIVFFPGAGGSRLEAKLDKNKSTHSYCIKKEDWFTIWVNAEEFWPGVVDCWTDNLRLKFANGTFMNNTGVQIRVPGFGNTTTVEYLDPGIKAIGKYLEPFVEFFVKLGYVRGKSIRAVPYDWRLSPNFLAYHGYFNAVKALIEDTYTINGNTPVSIVTHSYGGPVSLYFLTQVVDQQWKDKFIHAYLPLGGVWKGSASVVHLLVSGDNQGIFTLLPEWLRIEQRSFPASAFLLPPPSSDTWSPTDYFVVSPEGNFSAYNYEALYKSLNFTEGYEIYKSVSKMLMDLPAPQVPTYCFYGTGILTPMQFVYTDKYPDYFDHVKFSDGDGTVNVRSSRACLQWKAKQTQPFFYKEFPKVVHITFERDPGVMEAIKEVVLMNNGTLAQV